MDDILSKLVSIPTASGDLQSCHEALDYIEDFVRRRGMHVERFDSNGHESIVATTRPGVKRPKVILAAHVDVVPGNDAMFELRLEDGKYYGRGVVDMKFAIATYMQVIDELRESLTEYDFGLMITTDEEIGGLNGTALLVEEGYLPQVCILPDGGDDWQIQIHSKGFLYLKLSTHGKIAHGSRPWLGKSAIDPLMQVIQEVKALFAAPAPDVSTINIGTVSGGNTINQVADYAEVQVDIRVIDEQQRIEILRSIQEICRHNDADMEIILNGAVAEFDLADPMIAPFVQAIESVTGIRIEGARTLGSNDARYFAPHGIPCISLYPTGGGHHGPDEWLDRQAFHQFKDVLLRYLHEVATTDGSQKLDFKPHAVDGSPIIR